MPDSTTHPWDDAASEVTQWLTDEPGYYAEALKGGHQTPFSAQLTQAQKLDYYRRQFFKQTPDGSVDYSQPNPQGRDMVQHRVGIAGYTQAMSQVLATQPRAGLAAPAAPAPLPEPPAEMSAQPEMSGSPDISATHPAQTGRYPGPSPETGGS